MPAQLTNHLWQSSLFAVAIGLLSLAFLKNRAPVRYWLWFSASLKFLIPFALLIGLGSRVEWAPSAKKLGPQLTASAVSFTMAVSQPFFDSPPAPPTNRTRDWTPIGIFGVWACGFAAIALVRLRG